jgi:AcrR family transcriptional regulator
MLTAMKTQEAGSTAHLWSHVEPIAARRLLLAAVQSFAEVGYHASTTREIAERAGLSPAAVYVYYASKMELLETISTIGHEAAFRVFQDAIAGPETTADRVRGAVSAFAAWHAENHTLARIIQLELKVLPPDTSRRIRSLRKQFEVLLQTELQQGVEKRVFEIDDVPATANAILSLCIDITRWYSPRRARSPRQLGDLYAELSLRMIAPQQL